MSSYNLEFMYLVQTMSLRDIYESTGIPISTVRQRLLDDGVVLRSQTGGFLCKRAKTGNPNKGKKRAPFSQSHKNRISAGRRAWSSNNASGISLKPSGYIEYTTGPLKGRGVHCVVMEIHLGRRLLRHEVVHHRDENRSNNHISNLEVMTRSNHTRYHRLKCLHTAK